MKCFAIAFLVATLCGGAASADAMDAAAARVDGVQGRAAFPGGGRATPSAALEVQAISPDQLVGQWRCQVGNRSRYDRNFENWVYEFVLVLQPDFTFDAQGSYLAESAGYAVNFTAQGRWGLDPDGVMVEGLAQHADETNTRVFSVGYQVMAPGFMSFRASTEGGDYVAACER